MGYNLAMAERPIAPVGSGADLNAEATAGNQGVIFTATDRQVIKERSSEPVQDKSFIEIFKKKPLSAEIEAGSVEVDREQKVEEIKGRFQRHRSALKNSAIVNHRERVEITHKTPDDFKPGEPAAEPTPDQKQTNAEIKAIAEELKLDDADLFDKFQLGPEELHKLVTRIKEFHLQRLLADTQAEFVRLTEEIKSATLASAFPDAREWLEAQLKRLTLDAAQYKIKLLESLEALEQDPLRQADIKWLKRVAEALSQTQ